MVDVDVKGTWEPRFDPVVEAFRENFTERGDVGASFAVFKEGRKVVDIWGGHKDRERTDPWLEDTLVCVFSTTKTMTFLVSLILIDRGELDPQDPVHKFWPEFKANGKENVRFVDLLTHASGVAGLDVPVTEEEILDWELVTSRLAEQAPWWEPGTKTGYHALTQGHLIGEVVRRITGQTIGSFFHEEVARPLHADFHIGTPPSVQTRMSANHQTPGADTNEERAEIMERLRAAGPPVDIGDDAGQIQLRIFASADIGSDFANSPAWRQAEIPAGNGVGNARSVARAQHVVANGGEAFGVRLMSEETARRAVELQIEGPDLVFQTHMAFGLGYGLPVQAFPQSPSEHAGFWGGAGGSSIVIDLDERMSFSYTMNLMSTDIVGDLRASSLGDAVYRSLGKL